MKDSERQAHELRKRWQALERREQAERAARRRELRQRHKLERQAFLLELRSRGANRQICDEVLRVLAGVHRSDLRDLEGQFRAEQRARTAADADGAEAEQGNGFQFTVAWQSSGGKVAGQQDPVKESLSPFEALALRDGAAIERWNALVRGLSPDDLVAFLRNSHLPVLRRPVTIPSFDEVMTIPAVPARLAEIRESRDTKLQQALGNALSPTSRGRRPSKPDAAREKDKLDLRGRLTIYLQLAQRDATGDVIYRARCRELIDDELPDLPELQRHELARAIGRRAVNPSVAAAHIVARKLGISVNQARRGRSKRPSRLPARPGRIQATTIEAAEHVLERRRRGRTQPHRDDD